MSSTKEKFKHFLRNLNIKSIVIYQIKLIMEILIKVFMMN